MIDSKSIDTENALTKPDIHQKWISTYYSPEREVFYNLAFSYLINKLKPKKNSTFLDVGCGNCIHSIRLANKGFSIQAIDFSETVLEMASDNIKKKGLMSKITIKWDNLLNLSYKNKTFNYILCWGVLMHIPDIEKAILELSRVLKPEGILIIQENNMYSLQSILMRKFNFYARKNQKIVKNKTSAGLEHIPIKSTDMVFTREANINWLIKQFKDNRIYLKKRCASEFTEAYVKIKSKLLNNLIHMFNNFWFKSIKIPYLAFGNILIFQKLK